MNSSILNKNPPKLQQLLPSPHVTVKCTADHCSSSDLFRSAVLYSEQLIFFLQFRASRCSSECRSVQCSAFYCTVVKCSGKFYGVL